MKWNVMICHLRGPSYQNQPSKSKTVAYKADFVANFDFSTKPEVLFNFFKNGDRHTLAILQSPYMPNFKSLSCLVRSTGAFIFNRE